MSCIPLGISALIHSIFTVYLGVKTLSKYSKSNAESVRFFDIFSFGCALFYSSLLLLIIFEHGDRADINYSFLFIIQLNWLLTRGYYFLMMVLRKQFLITSGLPSMIFSVLCSAIEVAAILSYFIPKFLYHFQDFDYGSTFKTAVLVKMCLMCNYYWLLSHNVIFKNSRTFLVISTIPIVPNIMKQTELFPQFWFGFYTEILGRNISDISHLADLPSDYQSNTSRESIIRHATICTSALDEPGLEIDESDILESLHERLQTNYGYLRSWFSVTWMKEVLCAGKYSPHLTFLQVILSTHGSEFFSLGFLKLLICIATFTGPVMLGQLVAFIETADQSKRGSLELLSQGLFLVFVLCSLFTFSAVLNNIYNAKCAMAQLHLKGSLTSILFQKALCIPPRGWHDLGITDSNISNIIQIDIDRVSGLFRSVHDLWAVPLQIVIAFVLLYVEVKVAFASGVGIICVILPLNTWVAKSIGTATTQWMQFKDRRIQIMTETINNIKSVKMMGMEDVVIYLVEFLRLDEVKSLKVRKYLDAVCVFLWASMPVLILYVTFTTSVLVADKLTPSKMFTAIALLNMLVFPMNAFPWIVNGFVETSVSLKRIAKVLSGHEKDKLDFGIGLDEVDMHSPDDGHSYPSDLNLVNASWTVSTSYSDVETMSSKKEDFHDGIEIKRPLVEGNSNNSVDNKPKESSSNRFASFSSQNIVVGPVTLTLGPGEILGITGPVACGKSLMLQGLLRELDLNGCKKLECSSYIGYCAQVPSLHSECTIRDNVLYGEKFDQQRYLRVIQGCCLDQDFKSTGFSRGDMTTVAQNAQNLSGGQRLRIGLARALYSSAPCLLLDDPFSALDRETTRRVTSFLVRIVKDEGRVCVLTSHQRIPLESCHQLMLLDHGKPIVQGPRDSVLKSEVYQKTIALHKANSDDDDGDIVGDTSNSSEKKNKGLTRTKSMDGEHDDNALELIRRGKIRNDVVTSYLKAIGIPLCIAIVLSTFFMQFTSNAMSYWLAYWVSHQSKFSTTEFIVISSIIVSANVVFALLRSFLFAFGGIKSAVGLHERLLKSVMRTHILFFEENSSGKIINRFGKDTNCIDDDLPFMSNIVLAQVFLLLGSFVVIMATDPFVIIVILVVAYIYYRIQAFYRQASRQLRRLETMYRSPVYSLVNDCLEDSSTIRSMQKVQYFVSELERRLDRLLRVSLNTNYASLWLGVRLQMLGVVITTSLAISAILCSVYQVLPVSPGLLGLSLVFSLTIVNNLNGLIGSMSQTEQELISVERVHEYSSLSNELYGDDFECRTNKAVSIASPSEVSTNHVYRPLISTAGEDDDRDDITVIDEDLKGYDSFPLSGSVEMSGLSLFYPHRPTPALSDITVDIASGSRVAVIGRTGSGKSSLLRVLLGLNSYSGSTKIGGYEVRRLPVMILRDRISVIPQDPIIFTGTIRFNLDPKHMYSDSQLAQALEMSGLTASLDQSFPVVRDSIARRAHVILDCHIENGGKELSQGQKQLIGLARILVRRSKLILIDEATASIDSNTEKQIYTVLKDFAISNNSTILCICHKLESVSELCDKVLELKNGKVIKYSKI